MPSLDRVKRNYPPQTTCPQYSRVYTVITGHPESMLQCWGCQPRVGKTISVRTVTPNSLDPSVADVTFVYADFACPRDGVDA